MITYWKFISKSFQRSSAYRLEYYTGLFNAFLYIFIFSSVWMTVSKESPQHLGQWNSEKLVEYAILSTLIKVSFGKNELLISNKIKSGDIVYDFLKPYNLMLMYLADSLGVSFFQTFARSIPLLIFSFLFFGIKPSIDLISFLQFLPVHVFAFLLFVLMGFCISCLAFYFTEVFSFLILYNALLTLMSGSVIPVDLLPKSFMDVVLWTPFPYLYYYPTMILTQSPISIVYSDLLFRYVVQLLLISILAFVVYSFGRKKLEIAGG